jgi:predicted nucleic acid-binding protein
MALTLTVTIGHRVSDCLCLALAEQSDSQLVTADRRFYQAFVKGGLGHRMLWVEAIAQG